MKNSNTVRLALALIALSFARAAEAAATFTDEPTFLAATGPLGFESFEGLTATNTTGTVETLILADFTMTHGGPTDQSFDTLTAFDSPTEGQFPIDGVQWVYSRTDFLDGPEPVIIDFDQPIDAFGFWMTDPLDVPTPGSFEITLATNGGDAVTVLAGQQANGAQAFFGLIADAPFTQVVLTNLLDEDGIGLDAFHYGEVVPEPASLVLAACGLLGLAIAGWRRLKR